MDIEGKNVLVLGAPGLVGTAVCREILRFGPASLVVASRRKSNAQRAAENLLREHAGTATRIVPAWGDVFLRAEWGDGDGVSRTAILADPATRRALISDILEPLSDEIVASSLLAQLIQGREPPGVRTPARIVIDCINTATVVSYQNVWRLARDLLGSEAGSRAPEDASEQLETLLASLYVPQVVRHIQILFEAMRRAGTVAYVKVGTSGTGGMGFNIPYTHGEEKPSRLLLSKAAIAGAQSLLTFLMGRTPGGPRIVKEVKPAALIGWKEIAYGPVLSRGREIPLFDCPPKHAVSAGDPGNLAAFGDFGRHRGENLKGVFIDTGENGLFSADEFAAITSLGQMELVTPEEIARNVVAEIVGGSTGRDIVAALDGAVMGPSYRGGYLRETALNRLRRLEAEHGESVAFEILGPPRLSKLLYEAHLLKRAYGTMGGALTHPPAELAAALDREIHASGTLRARIISIGIPILLSDGDRLLRGPVVKSQTAADGWVDLTPKNMAKWQERFRAIRMPTALENGDDTSSRHDRVLGSSRDGPPEDDTIHIGDIVAWIFENEERGERGKD